MEGYEQAGSFEELMGEGTTPAPAPETGEPVPAPVAGEQTPTPAPVPGDPEPAPTAFDFSSLGDFKDVDEVKAALSGLGRIPELEGELESANSRVTELSKSNFEDPTLYRLNEAKKSNPEQFETYKELVFGNPAPVDVLKADFISKHPEYKDRAEDVELRIRNKYSAYLGADADPDSDEFRLAKMDLEVDAKDARDNILKPLNEIEVPQAKTEEEITAGKDAVAKTQREFAQSWKTPFENIKSSVSKFTIGLQGEKDKEVRDFLDFEITEEMQTGYLKDTIAFIEQGGVKADDDGIASAKAFAENIMLIDNKARIFNAIAVKARELSDEDWRSKVYNNIRPDDTTGVHSTGQGSKSKADIEQQRMLDEA